MTNEGVKFEFKAKPWQDDAPGAWCFVTLPEPLSLKIREAFKPEEEGWGRLKATAEIGNSNWKTAIWYDTGKKAYLLPLKAVIRKKENITNGELIQIRIWI